MLEITQIQLRRISPFAKQYIISALAKNADILDSYKINTPLRVAHFIAQIAHESAHFRTLEEYASGHAYEGRKDLGNTQRGDGKRYKGRGYIQLTGRANYKKFGDILGINLVDHPDRALDPVTAIKTACSYWQQRRLSNFADKNDIRGITRRINGGYNGLADRKKKFAKAWKIWGEKKSPVARVMSVSKSQVANWQKSKGLTSDGVIGPMTWEKLTGE